MRSVREIVYQYLYHRQPSLHIVPLSPHGRLRVEHIASQDKSLNASCNHGASKVVVSPATPTIVVYCWSVFAACSRFAEDKCPKHQS
jgi:hypothetical protein